MHILVTNDDGIQAPGLLALVNAMRPLGKVSVLAPDHNWSASGHVKTLHRPLRIRETLLSDGSPAFCSDGAPSDCVALAVLGFLPEPVDLVVSGVNPNANVAQDLTYSGTVTAAMEGVIWGIRSAAFSLDSPENHLEALDYNTATLVARQVVEMMVKQDLPKNILLNVNIPYLPPDRLKGFCITRQGDRVYKDALIRREDPRGRPYYWIGGEVPSGVWEEDTDIGAMADGYVSVTPIQLDLTAYNLLEKMRSWDWKPVK